jgi:hypothetical protein
MKKARRRERLQKIKEELRIKKDKNLKTVIVQNFKLYKIEGLITKMMLTQFFYFLIYILIITLYIVFNNNVYCSLKSNFII